MITRAGQRQGLREDALKQRHVEDTSWYYWCPGWLTRGRRSDETLLEA